jgi:hypothetical protein
VVLMKAGVLTLRLTFAEEVCGWSWWERGVLEAGGRVLVNKGKLWVVYRLVDKDVGGRVGIVG